MARDQIAEMAEELVSQYRDATSAYNRTKVITENIQAIKPSKVRSLVTHFYGDKVPVDHGDLRFLYKLLAYAVVQESATLTEEQLKVYKSNQEALLLKGPSSDAAYSEDGEYGKDAKNRGGTMETQTESTKKAKAPKAPKTPKAKWYTDDQKFVLDNAEGKYRIAKEGRPALVCDLLKKPITMKKLIERYTARHEAGDLGVDPKVPNNVGAFAQGWVPQFVKWLVDVKKAGKIFTGEEEAPAPKESKKKKKKKSAQADG